MTGVAAAFRLLRPEQWIKNVFVLAGAFFAGKWMDVTSLRAALLAFASFCLASSAVYVLNDLFDRDADRRHPRKRNRPLASGAVGARTAGVLGLVIAAAALTVSVTASRQLAGIVCLYLGINAAYSIRLKHLVLADVFCIASGFLLRLLAGTWGIGIPPSQWFLLCGFLLSLFLGFAKRYAEMADATVEPAYKRAVMGDYSPEFLRLLLAVTMACTLMAYGLYTVSPHAVAFHGTERLIYTLPVAAFVMFRYLWLVLKRGYGEEPSTEWLRDPGLWMGLLVYLGLSGSLMI